MCELFPPSITFGFNFLSLIVALVGISHITLRFVAVEYGRIGADDLVEIIPVVGLGHVFLIQDKIPFIIVARYGILLDIIP